LSENQNEDRFPIIFLKDVKYCDLESLVKFIYSGKTEVSTANLSSCTSLAETLGVSGYANNKPKSPIKRKSADFEVANKENSSASPFVKWSASEPVAMPSLEKESSQMMKRRKIHSLNNIDTQHHITPPYPFKSAARLPLSPLVSQPSSPLKSQHTAHVSCPVDSPLTPKYNDSKLPHASMVNNFSFDSTFAMMDPSELASKGASILQHLALWMLEEQNSGGVSQNKKIPSSPLIIRDPDSKFLDPPPPPPPNSISSNPGTATITRRLGGGSECDRPDSGFDSKEEDEVKPHHAQVSETINEEAGVRTASSGDTSPDITVEISRQAAIRQPIIRKRRLHH
jgi:hypothetical protein